MTRKLVSVDDATVANDDIAQRKSGTWVNRTVAQLKTDLGVAADIAAAQLVTINPQSGTSYTLVLTDANKAVEMSNAAANTVTVPPNSSAAFTIGTVIEIAQVGAGQTTVAAGAGVTINASTTLKTRAQWSSLAIRKRATDSWLLTGDAI